MSFQEGVKVERQGTVAIVTMSNPERRNAFYPEMRRQLTATLNALGADTELRAVVLTGDGAHFCAGADTSRMRQAGTPTPIQVRENMKDVAQLLRAIAGGGKPIIAAVEGDAFGAGFAMALACDVVVAARNARFGSVFTKVGLLPDMGMLYTLQQRVGPVKARQLMMLGTPVDGAEAARIGISDELAEPGQALAAALAFAARFDEPAPVVVSLIKGALATGVNSIEDAIRLEYDLQPMLASTQDRIEGMAALKEKRKPRFTGR